MKGQQQRDAATAALKAALQALQGERPGEEEAQSGSTDQGPAVPQAPPLLTPHHPDPAPAQPAPTPNPVLSPAGTPGSASVKHRAGAASAAASSAQPSSQRSQGSYLAGRGLGGASRSTLPTTTNQPSPTQSPVQGPPAKGPTITTTTTTTTTTSTLTRAASLAAPAAEPGLGATLSGADLAQPSGQAASRGTRSHRAAALAQVRLAHPWLFTSWGEGSGLNLEQREQWGLALQQALPLLASCDMASPEGRAPPLGAASWPSPLIEPSLSARAAARWEAAHRVPIRLPLPISITLPGLNPAPGPALAATPSSLPHHLETSQSPALPTAAGKGADVGRMESGAERAAAGSSMATGAVWEERGEAVGGLEVAVLDSAWQRRQQAGAPFRAYMQELQGLLLPGMGAGVKGGRQRRAEGKEVAGQEGQGQGQGQGQGERQAVDSQLAYQAGLCDDWLQLSHLATVFQAQLGPTTLTSLFRRMGDLVTPRASVTWGPGERAAFIAFVDVICAAAAAQADLLNGPQLGCVLYSLACTQHAWRRPPPQPAAPANTAPSTPSSPLGQAPHFSDVAGHTLCWDELAGVHSSAVRGLVEAISHQAQSLLQPLVGRVGPLRPQRLSSSTLDQGWGPGPCSQLAWSLGTLGAVAAAGGGDQAGGEGQGQQEQQREVQLMEALCRVSYSQLEGFSAVQLWGLVWGCARTGHAPDPAWLERFLGAAHRIMKARPGTAPAATDPKYGVTGLGLSGCMPQEFDGEGLSHLLWALGCLQQQPPRLWLRAAVGQLVRCSAGLQPTQLLMSLEGLVAMRYLPREEVSRRLLSAVQRQLHAFSPSQTSTLMFSLAASGRWRPHHQFLHDVAAASLPRLRRMTPREAAQMLWAFASFRQCPDTQWLQQACLAVARTRWAVADSDSLALATWAMADLGPKAVQVAHSLPCPLPHALPQPTLTISTAPPDILDGSWGPLRRGESVGRLEGNGQGVQEERVEGGPGPGSGLLREVQAVPGLPVTAPSAALGVVGLLQGGGLTADPDQVLPVDSREQAAWVEGCMVRMQQVPHSFSAPGLANALWGLAELGCEPAPELLDRLLRDASSLLPSFTSRELSDLIAALARLQYRPSDAWLALYMSQVKTRLGAFEGDDWGLTLWGLAALGAPLTPAWLQALSRSASQKWYSHSGRGLALLVHGLALYDFRPRLLVAEGSKADRPAPDVAEGGAASCWRGVESEEQTTHTSQQLAWWQGFFRECERKWSGMGPREVARLLLAVAQLVPTPPDREWQRGLVRTLRAHIARPKFSQELLPRILAAADAPLILSADTVAKKARTLEMDGDGSLDIDDAAEDAAAEDAEDEEDYPLLTLEAVCADARVRSALHPTVQENAWFAALLHELRRHTLGFPDMAPKRKRKRPVSPAQSAAGASGSGQQVQGQGQAVKVVIAERRQVIKAAFRGLVEAAKPDLSPEEVDAVVAQANQRMTMGSMQCCLAAVMSLTMLLQSFLGQPTPGFPAAGPAPCHPPPPDPACPPYSHPRLPTRHSPRSAAPPAQLPPPVRHAKCVRGLKWCHEVPPNPPPPPPPPAPLAQDPPAPAQELPPPPPPALDQPPAQPPPGPVPLPQAPPWGRWLDRDTNPCLNFQRIGESMQRPLELCSWTDLRALPPVGKEYQQRYKLVIDRLPKVRQRLHRAAEYRRGIDGRARNNALQGSSWVVTRSRTSSRRFKTKGVVHFIGGAFAGAAPQVLYALLLELVAAGGYTLVATPYAVTFQHQSCAEALRAQFQLTLQELRGADSSWLAPVDAPLLGLGHSNGSLMHLLIGSQHPDITAANVLMSFNNKQVQDAIPIPGFLASLSPSIKALREAPLPVPLLPSPYAFPDAATLLAGAASLIPRGLGLDDAGQISRAALALEQVGTVFGEVGDGTTDFSPTPAESQQIIRQGFRTPSLFIRFADDTIDETFELAGLLQSSVADQGRVKTLVLPGSHITPCGGDIKWESGRVFGPVDALVQLGKWQAQADLRRLSDQVIAYLDDVSRSH
ncbi:hypothetical protein QJQ45_027721 [Haematococcus lacustris]|nr:hypothetical protein QJQ45_027721 [Haematococcus lacustris]